ncbi:Protein lysine acetyltransferase Pat [Halioglobus japonicus]|nr:Protein lysine acetyltransferase Pat [Halioglobus japonicus]
MTATVTVHIIDANGHLGAALQCLLDQYDIQVNAYKTTAEFLSSTTAAGETSSCLLLALDSACERGLAFVKEINHSRPELPIIVLCDSTDESLREQYIALGTIDIVSKSMVDAYIFTRLSTILPGAASLPSTQPSTMQLRDGTAVTFRMISPEDARIEHDFVVALSERSRYLRFFSGLKELPDYMTRELVDTHYPISYALIATVPTTDGDQQIGVARYSPTETKGVAEFAVVVTDKFQGNGIGSKLLQYIVAAAAVAGLNQLEGLILRENTPMLMLSKKLGFTVSSAPELDGTLVKVVKKLR